MQTIDEKGNFKDVGFNLGNIQIDEDRSREYNRRMLEEQRNNFRKRCGLDSDYFDSVIDFKGYSAETVKNLRMFVENVRGGKGGFLIINGNVGTGKTSAAAAVMNELMKGTYYDMPELELKLNTADRYNSTENREMFLHSLARCELLVLDEIGRFPEKRIAEQSVLFYLANRRFQNKRPTIMCTNLTSREFADFMGQALIDRIRSNRIRVELNGESLRGKQV